MTKPQGLGIVAYSFGLRPAADEPNPSNLRLAQETAALARDHPAAVIVAQWEVAKGLHRLGIEPELIVEPTSTGEYLDSEGVWREAERLFRDRGIKRLFVVAHPFLHINKTRALARHGGFLVLPLRLRHIGFDKSPDNTQWWTRGPLRLLAYAILQRVVGFRGSTSPVLH